MWNDDAVASTSFGHGINVTPLALARAYGAVLNGGKLIPMTIRKLEPNAKVDGPRVMSERTSLQMLSIMRANVTGGSAQQSPEPDKAASATHRPIQPNTENGAVSATEVHSVAGILA